jgi:tetratricopeptide (TPR) repeat protein
VVALVGILAFLLASFPARNNDLWLHLARGRALAHLKPSLSAVAGPSAAMDSRPTWLYDLFVYSVWSLFGGIGLVVGKALLVVGIAVCLLLLARGGPWGRSGLSIGCSEAATPPRGAGWFLASFCTVLALLAMSVFLELQPATGSYLLLPLALLALQRADRGGSRQRGSGAGLSFRLPPLPVVVLFVVWANVAGDVVIGLGTVALVWLGTILDTAGRREAAQDSTAPVRRPLGGAILSFVWSLAVLAAVCLLNPAPASTFALPAELTGTAAQGSSTTADNTAIILSPFQSAYITGIRTAPAAAAYILLLGLSLLSFLLNLPRWHWQRFLPWLALALGSAVRVRAVPFFAVVAAPVLAWNVAELLARRVGPAGQERLAWRVALRVGHALTMLLVVLLPLCAWPGWLQGPPFEPRRWAVEPAASLEKGVLAVRDWLREGKLGSQPRGLHLSREAAWAFAWFCPEEQGVRDDHLAAAIRGEPEAPADCAQRLRTAGIDHLVLYDTDRGRLFATLVRLREDTQQWPLLYMEGQLAIFGWRDPAAATTGPGRFADVQLDFDRLAFHPAADKKARSSPVPHEPKPRQWWEAFWRPVSRRPLEVEEAVQYLFHAEALQQSAFRRHLVVWTYSNLAGFVGSVTATAQGRGLAGAPGLPVALAGLDDAHLRLGFAQVRTPESGARFDTLPQLDQLAHWLFQRFSWLQDDTNPALLYLAIRSARRALDVNAEDAHAYLVLGECYHRLLQHTRERAWAEQFPHLAQLRRAQASAALNRAIALRPDFAQAHLTLANLYGEMGYLDLQLEHLQTCARLRQAGASVGPGAPSEEELRQFAKEVQRRRDSHTLAAVGGQVLERAIEAYQRHLAGLARDLLLQSDIAAFGPDGMLLELELLLRTGRARDVRDWTSPEHKATLGGGYHWLRAQAMAADGDYASARDEFDQLSPALLGQQARSAMAALILQGLLDELPATTSFPDRLRAALSRSARRQRLDRIAQALQREADSRVLRGLLWLEEGDVEEAEISFREALSLWKDKASAASGAGLDFPARPVAQASLAWLSQP